MRRSVPLATPQDELEGTEQRFGMSRRTFVSFVPTTPGQMVRREDDRIPHAFSNKLSPHQHGINDVLANLALLGRSPRRLVLFGMTPKTIALGMELTPEIAAAIPELGRRVLAELGS